MRKRNILKVPRKIKKRMQKQAKDLGGYFEHGASVSGILFGSSLSRNGRKYDLRDVDLTGMFPQLANVRIEDGNIVGEFTITDEDILNDIRSNTSNAKYPYTIAGVDVGSTLADSKLVADNITDFQQDLVLDSLGKPVFVDVGMCKHLVKELGSKSGVSSIGTYTMSVLNAKAALDATTKLGEPKIIHADPELLQEVLTAIEAVRGRTKHVTMLDDCCIVDTYTKPEPTSDNIVESSFNDMMPRLTDELTAKEYDDIRSAVDVAKLLLAEIPEITEIPTASVNEDLDLCLQWGNSQTHKYLFVAAHHDSEIAYFVKVGTWKASRNGQLKDLITEARSDLLQYVTFGV